MTIEELASKKANEYVGHEYEIEEDLSAYSGRVAYKDGFEAGAYYMKEHLMNKICSMLIMFNCEQAKRFGPKAVLSCTDFTINVHNFRQLLETYEL